VVSWPFEHGLPDAGMGAGAALLARDPELHDRLAAAGWATTVERIPAADPTAPEVARQFDLLRALSLAVGAAVARGAFPLVLAGGCLSAAGTLAGSGAAADAGVVWLDAHADLDTPEDNVSGFLDVMALSVVMGRCWGAHRRTIPGHVPVPPERVALLGARDLAGYQRAALERSGVARDLRDRLPARTYLHVDLDVLDAGEGRANHYAAPGGPSLDEVLGVVDAVFAGSIVVAAAITAYDPSADADGRALAAARTIAERIGLRARAQRRA
jgi:arginase